MRARKLSALPSCPRRPATSPGVLALAAPAVQMGQRFCFRKRPPAKLRLGSFASLVLLRLPSIRNKRLEFRCLRRNEVDPNSHTIVGYEHWLELLRSSCARYSAERNRRGSSAQAPFSFHNACQHWTGHWAEPRPLALNCFVANPGVRCSSPFPASLRSATPSGIAGRSSCKGHTPSRPGPRCVPRRSRCSCHCESLFPAHGLAPWW